MDQSTKRNVRSTNQPDGLPSPTRIAQYNTHSAQRGTSDRRDLLLLQWQTRSTGEAGNAPLDARKARSAAARRAFRTLAHDTSTSTLR